MKRNEMTEEIKRAIMQYRRPMFWGREMQSMKADLALRVLNKQREMEQVFQNYGAVDNERVKHAQEKRDRKAARRLKEKNHE
jgi:hypothetical protein